MDRDEYEDCMMPARKCQKYRGCGEYILGILFVTLGVILGLIFGAVYATTLLAALSALIAFAIMIVILIIIRIVSILCNKNKCY